MVPICSKKRKKSLAFLKVCIRGSFAESVNWVFSHFTKVSRSVCAHGSGNNVFSRRGTDFMFGLIRLIELSDRAVEFWWNTSPDRFSSQLFFRPDKWTSDVEYDLFLLPNTSIVYLLCDDRWERIIYVVYKERCACILHGIYCNACGT